MHGIVTESMFPLGQREENVSVLVEDWSDLSESPSQAIARLNQEAMDNAERHREAEEALVKQIEEAEALAEYLFERPESNGNRPVVHATCGTVVGTLPAADFSLGPIVNQVGKHDCSIGALITTKGKISQLHRQAVTAARRLSAGITGDRAYLRGVAEMLCTTLGLPTDRQDEVIDWLIEGEDVPF